MKRVMRFISCLLIMLISFASIQAEDFFTISNFDNTGVEGLQNFTVRIRGATKNPLGAKFIMAEGALTANDFSKLSINGEGSLIGNWFLLPLSAAASNIWDLSLTSIKDDYDNNPFTPETSKYVLDAQAQVNWGNTTFNIQGGSGSGTTNFSFDRRQLTRNSPTLDDNEYSDLLIITFYENGAGSSTFNLPASQYKIAYQMATRVIIPGTKLTSKAQWTTTTPEIPYIILRDPPGDGSYSFIESGTTLCQGFGISVDQSGSMGAWASAKLGKSGSIGFLAEQEYEVYAEVTGSVEFGYQNITANSTEICYKTVNRFSTNPDQNPALNGKNGDVFVGAAVTYAYGVFESIEYSGEPIYKKDLMLSPISTNSEFLYTEEHIRDVVIPNQEQIISNTPTNDFNYQKLVDQLDMWNQVLMLNEDIKATAPLQSNQKYIAGPEKLLYYETTRSKVESLEMSLYIDAEARVQMGFEVGGSGASVGASVSARIERSSTVSNTSIAQKQIGYSFQDDDAGDKFDVDIYEDPVYGTPIFKLLEVDPTLTRTSCPFEGGYNRDQPALSFESGSVDSLFNNLPIGETSIIKLQICNDSDEARTYHLKMNNSSNPFNASLIVRGENIASNDRGIDYEVPANGCLQDVELLLTQGASTRLNYDSIELFLYKDCDINIQPNDAQISTSIFLSAKFNNSTPVFNPELQRNIKVYPNLTANHFTTVELGRSYENIEVKIKNLTGQILRSQKYNTTDKLQVDLPKDGGLYLLEIQVNQELPLSYKVVKI